jgi:hypothetical protein
MILTWIKSGRRCTPKCEQSTALGTARPLLQTSHAPRVQFPADPTDLCDPCVPPCSFQLFQKRKPGGQNQWSEKLPDFVKRLEHALFSTASTKVGSFTPCCSTLPRVGGHAADCIHCVVAGGVQ